MIARILSRGTVQVAAATWSILVIVPFVLIFVLSLRSNADIYANGLGVGGTLRPENYLAAWAGAGATTGMSVYFWNSIVVAVVAMTVNLAAGVTAAYFSTFLSEKWRRRFLNVFVVASVVPLILMIIPFYQVYNALGVLNQPWAVGIAYAVITLPTTILIMQAFYVDFPKELCEAAALDGAGPWWTYLWIVLPLSKGAVTAVSLLVLIFVWGETQVGVILLQDSLAQTVPVGLLSFQGQWTTNLGALFAGLAIASFPIMAIYLIFSKQITKGITMGGFGGR